MQVTPESVKTQLDTWVLFLSPFTKIIPGEFDDEALRALANLKEQPWFVNFVAFVINRLPMGKEVSHEEFKHLVQSFEV